MKPLFTQFFCPGDCDRKKPSTVDDDWDADTEPVPKWPECCGTAMAVFSGVQTGYHCWGCGKVVWSTP